MIYSNSALDRYETCPAMFKFHYIDKIRSKNTTSALTFGSCVDDALEELCLNRNLDSSISKFKELMNKWKDENNVEFYKKDFDWNSLSSEDIEYLNNMNKDDDKYDHQYGWRSLRGKGLDFINSFNDNILCKIDKVIATQKMIEIRNNDNGIIGYIDLIAVLDGVLTIIDFKTSSKSYSQRVLDESQQLNLYYFAIKKMIERKDIDIDLPEEIAYIVFRKDYDTKGNMRPIKIVKGKPCDKIQEILLDRFDNMIYNISINNFPRTEKKFTCKNHFGKPCIYREICLENKNIEEIEHLFKKE